MPKFKPLPSREVLQSWFSYDMETGLLRWRVRPAFNSRRRAGDEAGTLHHSGYIQVGIHGGLRLAHRIIWKMETGFDPVDEIDHRNGVRSENRWLNLRAATRSQQNMNKVTPNHHRGVHYIAARNVYGAQIKAGGEHIWLGCYDTPELACTAYRVAAARLHADYGKPGRCSCLSV